MVQIYILKLKYYYPGYFLDHHLSVVISLAEN